MNQQKLTTIKKPIIILCFLIGISPFTKATPLDNLLKSYQQAGATHFSIERGKTLWTTKHPAKNGGDARSCTSCHTADLTVSGKHIKTGKVIKPMAVASNPKRLTKARKMKKWLLRNCKWVMGRLCTPQEKGDILTFINTFK